MACRPGEGLSRLSNKPEDTSCHSTSLMEQSNRAQAVNRSCVFDSKAAQLS